MRSVPSRHKLPNSAVDLRWVPPQVLAGVLLHVVISALPVEFHLGGPEIDGSIKNVADNAVDLLHIEDLRAAKCASISRLAATLGVEDRVGRYGIKV